MKIPALVGKKDFDSVFKNSDTSFSSGPFVVILKKNKISSTRTGIIIQKKFVKLAVNRNIDLSFFDITLAYNYKFPFDASIYFISTLVLMVIGFLSVSLIENRSSN